MKQLVSQPKHSLSTNTTTSQTPAEYQLASLWRVFFARILDLLVSSLPFLVLGFFTNQYANEGNWSFIVINYTSALIVNCFYFVFVPWWCKGRTLGKWLCKIKPIKLTNQSSLGLKHLWWREMWMLIGPWIIYTITMLVFLLLITQFNSTNNKLYYAAAYIISQCGLLCFMGWMFFLAISIRLQPKHQCWIDLKYQIIIVNTRNLYVASTPPPTKQLINQTPGYLTATALETLAPNHPELVVDKQHELKELDQSHNPNPQITQKEHDDDE